MGHASPTWDDWGGWADKFEELETGCEVQYRVRLMDNIKGIDCAYPTHHLITDGTLFAVTYGHWEEGKPLYFLGFHLRMEPLDDLGMAL